MYRTTEQSSYIEYMCLNVFQFQPKDLDNEYWPFRFNFIVYPNGNFNYFEYSLDYDSKEDFLADLFLDPKETYFGFDVIHTTERLNHEISEYGFEGLIKDCLDDDFNFYRIFSELKDTGYVLDLSKPAKYTLPEIGLIFKVNYLLEYFQGIPEGGIQIHYEGLLHQKLKLD